MEATRSAWMAVDDFATAPGSAALAVTGSITVEAWVKINSLPTQMSGGIPVGFAPVASMWNDLGANNQRGYLLSVVSDGSVRFDVSHDGGLDCGLFPNTGPQSCAASHGALVISSAKVTVGGWTHIAGVFDAGTKTLQVFVNGVADTFPITVGSNVFHSSTPFMIGAADTGHIARQFTNGSIDIHLPGRCASSPWKSASSRARPPARNCCCLAWWKRTTAASPRPNGNPGKRPLRSWCWSFSFPTNPGTQITAIDGAGPHLPGWVTGNSALDALITGKKDDGKTVELHIATSTRVPGWEPKSNLTPDSTDNTGCGTKTDCMEIRCPWAKGDLYIEYHDTEWGVPVHDDRMLFEFLILEGAQAGLSWSTILNKRENYREAFDNFDARKIARYEQGKVDALLADAGIVRNRLKIAAAIRTPRPSSRCRRSSAASTAYIWQFVGGQPKQNASAAR